MPQAQIHETIAHGEKNHFLYQYEHGATEPYTITDQTTGHKWTRDNGSSIMKLLRELNRRRDKGLKLPATSAANQSAQSSLAPS